MNEQGITVWIDEPIDVLAARLAPEKDHRPLIRNLSDAELTGYLQKKRTERLSFYEQAAHHITTADINDNWFAKLIKQYA